MARKTQNSQTSGSETTTAGAASPTTRGGRRRRVGAKARGTTARAKSVRPARRRARPSRRRYSDTERQQILSAAQREGLTAVQVQRRFGVTPVTYYSWRRKSGSATGRRGRGRPRQPGVMESGLNLMEAIRGELRTQIQRMLPELVRTEVGAAFLGSGRQGRRRRRRP
jgi:transposase-like protein